MTTRKYSIIGVMIVLAALLLGCGLSKEQLRLKAQRDVKAQAAATLVEIRQATSGDQADQFAAKLRADLKSAGFGLGLIPVEQGELDQTIADKYFGDAKAQVAILRDPKISLKAAQTAQTEFYRTQKASGRPLAAFSVTAKTLNSLVAAAKHRAPAKKRSTKR